MLRENGDGVVGTVESGSGGVADGPGQRRDIHRARVGRNRGDRK
jgi:hypothetical protein